MMHRCAEDVSINVTTYHMLMDEAKGGEWKNAFLLTFKFFENLRRQEEYGWKVDRPWMEWCISTLDKRLERIDKAVVPRLPYLVDILEIKKDGERQFIRKPFLKSGKKAESVYGYAAKWNLGQEFVDAVVGPFSRILFRKADLVS